MFPKSKNRNDTSKISADTRRKLTFAGILILIVVAQTLIYTAFKQQKAKVLVQSAHTMLSVKGYANQAERQAEKAVELDKFEGYAWFNYGTALYLQKKFDESAVVLGEGIEYLPHSYNALRLIAFANYRMQKFDAAALQFQEYLTMIPHPPVTPELVYRMAGLSWFRKGDLARSNYYIMETTQLSKDKGDLLRIRSMVSLLSNELWSADYCYRAFRFYLPDEEFNPFETVVNAINSNKVVSTIGYLESILSRKPDDVSVIKALAAAYKSNKQVDKAEALLRDSVQKYPDSGTLRLVYGDILYSQNFYKEAFEQYDKHLYLMPDSPLRKDILQKKATSR